MVRKPKRMASSISGSEEDEEEDEGEDEEREEERERRERSKDQNSDVRRGRGRVEGPAAWRSRERVFKRSGRRGGCVYGVF